MVIQNESQAKLENIEEREAERRINRIKRTLARYKRKILSRHTNALRVGIVLGILLTLYLLLSLFANLFGGSSVGTYISMANNFVFTPKQNILMEKGRTNILLLGKAGGEYISPELTDTIMVVSISNTGGKTQLISVPRDIWVDELDTKINEAYLYGNEKQPGGGRVLARSIVEKVVGVPLHYTFVVDFSVLTDVVDIVGGVDVRVEKEFTDTRYPIAGKENDDCGGDPEYNCRYETLHFTAGMTHFDGTTALKFSRSRHSEDLQEGTDLARARRQQLVLSAIKDKILSREILASPNKIRALLEVMKNNVDTDITPQAGAILLRRLLQTKNDIATNVIPEDLLFNPPPVEKYRNLYVFIPNGEDWSEVHAWVASLLAGD